MLREFPELSGDQWDIGDELVGVDIVDQDDMRAGDCGSLEDPGSEQLDVQRPLVRVGKVSACLWC